MSSTAGQKPWYVVPSVSCFSLRGLLKFPVICNWLEKLELCSSGMPIPHTSGGKLFEFCHGEMGVVRVREIARRRWVGSTGCNFVACCQRKFSPVRPGAPLLKGELMALRDLDLLKEIRTLERREVWKYTQDRWSLDQRFWCKEELQKGGEAWKWKKAFIRRRCISGMQDSAIIWTLNVGNLSQGFKVEGNNSGNLSRESTWDSDPCNKIDWTIVSRLEVSS